MTDQTIFFVQDISTFKKKALRWASQFRVCCLLDSNNCADPYSSLEWELAVDSLNEFQDETDSFEGLKVFLEDRKETCFGFFTYDLKNQLERLEPKSHQPFGFPSIYFFEPRYRISIKGNEVRVNRNYPETFELRQTIEAVSTESIVTDEVALRPVTSKESYLQNVTSIKQKIEEGDFYELNYCCEFREEGKTIDPITVFERLNANAAAPFSTFFKWNSCYLLCASPERFMKKTRDKIISQPIKGTIKAAGDAYENELLRRKLSGDEKERAENVMIVDLVRNDLARTSRAGTVIVEELFGIHTFKTVNHMISTITSELDSAYDGVDAIKSAFPMGSMTGAPKVEVMRNIDSYEDQHRGLYSGAVGYFAPDGDFDFNVVIRAIQYNAAEKKISVQAGGAITYDSVPEKEYEEMLLKTSAMRLALSSNQTGNP